jgi:hypothetical protein
VSWPPAAAAPPGEAAVVSAGATQLRRPNLPAIGPSGRRLLVIGAVWSAAVLVSALQIYLREVGRGEPASWHEVLLANLLAWLPWLLVVTPALRLERRLPIAGPERWRNLAVHAAVATLVATLFLLYLSLFHLVYLERAPLSAAALRAEYGEKLGRFFLTAAALYGGIVVAGFAERSWRGRRGEPRQEIVGPRGGQPPAAALVVRATGRSERIPAAAVRWIAADGNYARLHLAGRTVLHRGSLAALADELGGHGFARIHRSTVVNLRCVRALKRRSHGDAVLVLDDGGELRVSRTYRKSLRTLGL